MYLYIVEITDSDGEISLFGTFRSERNAAAWGEEETGMFSGAKARVIPLLDPHYINDAD